MALFAAAAVVAGIVGLDRFGSDEPAAASPALDNQSGTGRVEQTPSDTPTPAGPPTTTASPTPTPTKTPTPTPTPTALIPAGSSGDDVRELQARLKQIQWYEPDITGQYDEVTVEAVEGFQAKRGLPETGDVDEETWDRLLDMTREPTDDEKHNRLTPGPTIIGPGDSGDDVRELQARLRQIGWFSGDITPNYGDVTRDSVAGFQTKRGFPSTGKVDQRTWDRLVEMTREPTDDELHNREPEADDDESAAALDPRCTTGRVLCIDKSTQSLRWVVDGEVQMTMDVRFGAEMTPTREGAFQVNFKSRDHVSSLYDTAMPYAMFFSGGQAVHYSPDFAANGYNGASHGCVNVRDKSAIISLFDQVNAGDKVIVYWS
ncbi:peptidoglycan hydrolase-like protein with peptidoglycan-binding domain [Haloactinopolyspora alba]|uniref:Peptidoglycan hydrolase-like protein with peptidoglycan-binding domain n=2 Tax=Haloactinopolyspora alba TaxID=648780 RepID=A0A2P8DZ26_9ACTN|nr:peptidoglycan hydrolase-like protein with peptidoglycan-binding domain [Haloactinopolyspora alba]